jgi:hypothetical protein
LELPLAAGSETASLSRNLAGLFVITRADGLEKYTSTFDLSTLPPGDVKPDGSITVSGEVHDPTGSYLPRAFTLKLPRNATAGLPHPANSLFDPAEIPLLPAPSAKVMAGWAQVRVTVKRLNGEAFPNVLVRIKSVPDGRILARGMSDTRGEGLVAISGLPLFQAGATEEEVVTSVTQAKVEFIPPATDATVVDWEVLDALAVLPANICPQTLSLKSGEVFSLQFSVTT